MPSAGLVPLRVGPEDVQADEAGELVSKLGVHNQAKALLAGIAKQMPKELRVAMQRTEYTERSKHLDEDEVLQQTLHTVDPDASGSVVYRILSARVKSSKSNPFDGAVVVLYETLGSRTAHCAILYNENTFPKSVRAYNEALREGKIELPGELSDRADLREALDATRSEAQRLATENAELRGEAPPSADGEVPPADVRPADDQPPAPVQPPEGVVPGDPGWPVDEATGELLDLPQSVRDSLIAAHERDEAAAAQAVQADEELARLRAEADVEPELTIERLPDGVATGDPGYPVDENGELLQMPQATREALIAQAEAQAAEDPDVAAAPIDLNDVEIPEGNADQIKAGIPFFSTPVVAAIAARDERSTVAAAATAELETRPDAPATTEG